MYPELVYSAGNLVSKILDKDPALKELKLLESKDRKLQVVTYGTQKIKTGCCSRCDWVNWSG